MVVFVKATLLSLFLLALGALPITGPFMCAQAASIPNEPRQTPKLLTSTVGPLGLGKGGSIKGTGGMPSVEIRQIDKLTFVPALLTDVGIVAPPPPSDDS